MPSYIIFKCLRSKSLMSTYNILNGLLTISLMPTYSILNCILTLSLMFTYIILKCLFTVSLMLTYNIFKIPTWGILKPQQVSVQYLLYIFLFIKKYNVPTRLSKRPSLTRIDVVDNMRNCLSVRWWSYNKESIY